MGSWVVLASFVVWLAGRRADFTLDDPLSAVPLLGGPERSIVIVTIAAIIVPMLSSLRGNGLAVGWLVGLVVPWVGLAVFELDCIPSSRTCLVQYLSVGISRAHVLHQIFGVLAFASVPVGVTIARSTFGSQESMLASVALLALVPFPAIPWWSLRELVFLAAVALIGARCRRTLPAQ